MRPLLFSLLSIGLSRSVGAQPVDLQASSGPCPQDPAVVGYTSIEAMNNDTLFELSLIMNGKEPEYLYSFVLCPGTVLDASNATLVPLLDNSMFLCGGNETGSCVINGGATQVEIRDSMTGTHLVTSVGFRGIDFRGFTQAAISGNAGKDTAVSVAQSRFLQFTSIFATEQTRPEGDEPFSLTLMNVSVKDAVAGVLFSNTGGVLSIEDLIVQDATMMAAVSTASVSTVGMVMIMGATVTSSSGMDLFVTMQGSRLTAKGVVVDNMVSIGAVFDIADSGTMSVLENVKVSNNIFGGVVPPPLWTVLNVRDGAAATIKGLSVSELSNVVAVVAATNSSRVTVEEFDGMNLNGGLEVTDSAVSAVFLAADDSQLIASDTATGDVAFFTAIASVQQRSNLTYRRSCVGRGDVVVPIFVDSNSTFAGDMNFIDPGLASDDCAETSMRLAKEQVGQTCFESDFVSCNLDCIPFFTEDVCVRQTGTNATSAPITLPFTEFSFSPSIQPTSFPSLSPNVGLDVSNQPSSAMTNAPSPVNSTEQTTAPAEVSLATPAPIGSTLTPSTSAMPTFSPVLMMTTGPAPFDTLTSTPSVLPGLSQASTSSPSKIQTPTVAGGATSSPNMMSIAEMMSPSISVTDNQIPSSEFMPDPSTTTQPSHSQTLPSMCIRRGKWVRREYQYHGKGKQTYYAFDKNVCAEYAAEITYEAASEPKVFRQGQTRRKPQRFRNRRRGKGKGKGTR